MNKKVLVKRESSMLERRVGEVFKDGDHFVLVVECGLFPMCSSCYYMNICMNIENFEYKCCYRKDGVSVYFVEIPKYRGNLGLSIQALKDEFERQLCIANIMERMFSILGKATELILKIKNKIRIK